ncbi:MAG TPA: glycogen-binding domain-containing protein [Longimicrobiaceae bacterium]|nr:glycogen-binding domain-containing protein [Longimicrobiaceae bacterium]
MRLLPRAPRLRLGVALLLLAPAHAAAQGAWSVELGAGQSAPDAAPVGQESTELQLGLRRDGLRWLSASAGLPVGSGGLAWGALGLGGRFLAPAGRLSLGADLDAQGFLYRDRDSMASGRGATVEAMPLLTFGNRSARLELRSGVVHYARVFAGETASRTVEQSDARAVAALGWISLSGEARYLHAAEGDYPYLGGGVAAERGPLTLSAYAGDWLSSAVRTPVWGVDASVRVLRGLELHATVRQETNDPLYWNAPQRSWSLGVRRALGHVPAPVAAIPARVPGRGGITFRLPRSVSRSAPRLAGDFTGWKDVTMAPSGDFWSVTLPVPPGVYHYAFRGEDGAWFVPESLPGREPDGFGGFNALLIVR